MRILVVSDSHGDRNALRRILLAQPEATLVIHLGDGARDAEQEAPRFPQKRFLQVRGNCDPVSSLPLLGEETVSGVRILYTHGHLYRVKSGVDALLEAAGQKGADMVLYGHTHVPDLTYEKGRYRMNPGSLRMGGTYGVIDMTETGPVPRIVRPNGDVLRRR